MNQIIRLVGNILSAIPADVQTDTEMTLTKLLEDVTRDVSTDDKCVVQKWNTFVDILQTSERYLHNVSNKNPTKYNPLMDCSSERTCTAQNSLCNPVKVAHIKLKEKLFLIIVLQKEDKKSSIKTATKSPKKREDEDVATKASKSVNWPLVTGI